MDRANLKVWREHWQDESDAAFLYAVSSGGSATLRLVVRWLDAGGVQIGTPETVGPAAYGATLWSRFTSGHIGPAPASESEPPPAAARRDRRGDGLESRAWVVSLPRRSHHRHRARERPLDRPDIHFAPHSFLASVPASRCG